MPGRPLRGLRPAGRAALHLSLLLASALSHALPDCAAGPAGPPAPDAVSGLAMPSADGGTEEAHDSEAAEPIVLVGFSKGCLVLHQVPQLASEREWCQ